MHYLKIVLVKAFNKEEAIDKADEVVQSYEGFSWDWYETGGRWKDVLEENCERLDLCWDKIKEYWECPAQKAESLMPKEIDYKSWNCAYELRRVSYLIEQSFKADHCFYNAEESDISIPYNKEEYFAVVFDLHN